MSTCIILNREARQGDCLETLRRLADREGFRLHPTEHRGHASELAAEAVRQGVKTVVAAGGDGTLNEVLNGLDGHLDEVRLGLLPLGTGNDFARSLGLPLDLEPAFEVLCENHTARCDVGRYRCDGRQGLFLNLSAAGFSGEVDANLDTRLKRFWGPLAYLRAAVETMPELTPYRLNMTIDEGHEEAVVAVNVVVANGRYVAAGLPVAPRARIEDGLLDVVVIRARRIAQLMALAPKVVAGLHLDDQDERIEFYRVRRARFDSRPQMPFNVDGELVGEGPAEFEVLPAALEILCPATPLPESARQDEP